MTSTSRAATTALVASAVALLCGCTESTTYAKHATRKLAPMGARVGLLGFGEFQKLEMSEAVSMGYYHRMGVKGNVIPEVTVETAMRTADDSDWQFYMAGGNVIYLPVRRQRFYIHGGGGVMSETLPNESYTAGYISAGAGYSLPLLGTALDIRLTAFSLLDSQNANAAYMFTLGYGF